MIEKNTDIWPMNEKGEWVCVTTNGIIKNDGTAVMGAGVALAAANRYPELPAQLAKYLKQYGNRVFVFPNFKIITFPTKHDFKHPSNLDLIKTSCSQLMAAMDKFHIQQVFLPRPGCKNGKLEWADVRPAITPLLDDRVIVCDTAPGQAPLPAEAQMDLFSAPAPVQIKASAATCTLPPAEFTNHSGGAYGADTEWDVIGREFGVTHHKHYREEGNAKLSKRLRDARVNAVPLTTEDLEEGYRLLEQVYKRTFDRNLQNNLKARNFFQVNNAEAIFAIGFLKGSKGVKGGTDAAVQMGISQGKAVYVFDLNTRSWTQWDGSKFIPTGTPTLTKEYAGIGTRDIENYQIQKDGEWTTRSQYVGDELADVARKAIEAAYLTTFGKRIA